MINLAGTGPQASSTLLTTTEPAGFYSLGLKFESATPLPAGTNLKFDVTLSPGTRPPRPINDAYLGTGVANQSFAVVSRDLWLEPGAVFTYEVLQTGSAPPHDWEAKVVLLREEDVS